MSGFSTIPTMLSRKKTAVFRIDHLPTGVELTFKAFHESEIKPFDERKITLQPGCQSATIELTIKSKR